MLYADPGYSGTSQVIGSGQGGQCVPVTLSPTNGVSSILLAPNIACTLYPYVVMPIV